jgi:hypothetical protein
MSWQLRLVADFCTKGGGLVQDGEGWVVLASSDNVCTKTD